MVRVFITYIFGCFAAFIFGCCFSYFRQSELTNNQIRETTERLTRAEYTITECRKSVEGIRIGLEGSADELSDIIEVLQIISEETKNMESCLYDFDNSPNRGNCLSVVEVNNH